MDEMMYCVQGCKSIQLGRRTLGLLAVVIIPGIMMSLETCSDCTSHKGVSLFYLHDMYVDS